MNNEVKFEQGNQARLDVTREELYKIEQALIGERRGWIDELHRLTSNYTGTEEGKARLDKEITVYERLIDKVREALDLYQ